MLIPAKVKKGYVLCYRGKSWIGFFDDGYEHVSLVSDIFHTPQGDIEFHQIEMHYSARNLQGEKVSGLLESVVQEKYYKNIEVYSLKDYIKMQKDINSKKIEQAILAYRGLIGTIPYDLPSFLSLWFYSKVLKPLGLANMQPKLNDEHKEVCSTAINRVFFIGCLGVDLLPNINDNAGTPSDIAHSKLLSRIC